MCLCFNSSSQEFGRPDRSWRAETSAVCVDLLWKPLAESFQSSHQLCCSVVDPIRQEETESLAANGFLPKCRCHGDEWGRATDFKGETFQTAGTKPRLTFCFVSQVNFVPFQERCSTFACCHGATRIFSTAFLVRTFCVVHKVYSESSSKIQWFHFPQIFKSVFSSVHYELQHQWVWGALQYSWNISLFPFFLIQASVTQLHCMLHSFVIESNMIC